MYYRTVALALANETETIEAAFIAVCGCVIFGEHLREMIEIPAKKIHTNIFNQMCI